MKITNSVIAFLAAAGSSDAAFSLRGRKLDAAECASTWSQCSGQNFNGGVEMCCEAGSTCESSSVWYGQCKPGGGSAPADESPPAPPASTATPDTTSGPYAAVSLWAGGEYFGTSATTRCDYDSSHVDMHVGVAMASAHGNAGGAKCGVCYRLTGAPNQWGDNAAAGEACASGSKCETEGNNADPSWSVVVKVVDEMHAANQVHGLDYVFDLPQSMFEAASNVPAGGGLSGRIPVQWEEVPCTANGLEDWTQQQPQEEEEEEQADEPTPPTPEQPQSSTTCASTWSQCSGQNFNGGVEMCCEAGSTCESSSVWYGQCKPARKLRLA